MDLSRLQNWLVSALSSTALLALLAFFCRNLIAQWITSSVRYSYDEKLEKLKAHNERELERLRGALDAQQNLVSSAFLEARRASNERRLSAIQTVWDGMMEVSANAPPCVVTTDVLTTELYAKVFKTEAIKATIPNFFDLALLTAQFNAGWGLPVEKARLMSGEYLYALFWAYRAFVGSIGFHLAISRDKGEFKPWWEYDHILNLLGSALSPEELKEFEGLRVGRYTWVTQNLERKFLGAAEEIIDGRRAASEAFEQARPILTAAKNLMNEEKKSGPQG
jgi:hypothetical protein